MEKSKARTQKQRFAYVTDHDREEKGRGQVGARSGRLRSPLTAPSHNHIIISAATTTRLLGWKCSGRSPKVASLTVSLELEAQATVLVRVHCSRHADARCRQARRGSILPLVPTLGASQASVQSGPVGAPMRLSRRGCLCALARRRGRLTGSECRPAALRRESDSSNMCVKALSRASVL